MTTFAERVIRFNKALNYVGMLPNKIEVINPFIQNTEIVTVSSEFYKRFYDDNEKRKLILGINPGRLGSGATGIPFTDTKRLLEIIGLKINSVRTHEPSSVFVYEMIEAFGGTEKFYKQFYINSLSPLGFIQKNPKGNWINCNYYDNEELFATLRPFIIANLKKQINLGIDTSICFVLGKKNAKYFKLINDEEKLFESFIVLDHPRYIIQYKSKNKEQYVSDYLEKLSH